MRKIKHENLVLVRYVRDIQNIEEDSDRIYRRKEKSTEKDLIIMWLEEDMKEAIKLEVIPQ